MASETFRPLLATTNWNEEWKALQAARNHADDATVWNEKAKTFPVKHGSQQGYAEHFLALADVRPGEVVLDMGCGTGALATPLAQAGVRVIACDFSHGMLSVMRDDQKQLGVSGVETHLMSWEDDWSTFGIGPESVDVALASRSIATNDLEASLRKLHTVARRRVCITLPAGGSPKSDPTLLAAAGFPNRIGLDFQYAFNILAANCLLPEVSYIPNTRLEVFPSREKALTVFSDIVQSAMAGQVSELELEQVPERLTHWLEQNLVHDETGYHLAHAREVRWAFISWNKQRA